MAQFVVGGMVGLRVNSGQALRPNQWTKSHYQAMNAGEVVGKGEPAFPRPAVIGSGQCLAPAMQAQPHWPQRCPKGWPEWCVTFSSDLCGQGRGV